MTEPPSVSEKSVLIVGAGPTGLTLACELARHGVSFRLIEASAGPQRGSRGKGLQPRSLEILDDLGIGQRARANGWLGMPIRSIAPDGKVTWGGAVPESLQNRPDIPYPASLLTPQWRVEEALRDRLAEFGGEIEFGTRLDTFQQAGDQVRAEIINDSNTRTVVAHWLIGCDGGHSVVRKQAGIAFDGETRENVRMIVGDVHVDGLERDGWTMWRHQEGVVSLCPLPSTDTFCYQAVLAPDDHAEPDLINMQAILERRSGRTDIRLSEPEWSSLWRANVRIVDRYRVGRALLAGDAAHIHSPAGGQGMNTGIQDAYNLGWKLAAVDHGASPALIDSYQAERRPVAAHVLTLSDTRLRQAMAQQEIRRDESTIQLDVNYRGSALCRDDRSADAALRAGDRAPDATGISTVTGPRRLFDLIGGGSFTLINFGTDDVMINSSADVRMLHVVDQPAGPDQVADLDGHLAEAYRPTERTLVLVRPDGYLGMISDAGDAAAVAEHLDQFTASPTISR